MAQSAPHGDYAGRLARAFSLVTWTPSLEKQVGRHVSGIAWNDGGIDWTFTRQRGIGW
jgi:hypothetical protein